MILNLKLTFFRASHHTYIHHPPAPFSVSAFDLWSHSKLKISVSAGAQVRWGISRNPLGLSLFLGRQVGWDGHQSVHTLSTRGLLWTHPPLALGNHHRWWQEAAKRSCAEHLTWEQLGTELAEILQRLRLTAPLDFGHPRNLEGSY